ncbi:organic solvent ABC transporter permease [Mangrovitalea sediminis]|uniref:organic solvent ABC transporter permease n=1 Tax=Mangrovitalea sediminis TaxID=1982043 RepID=UPI000BE6067D|nr:organic solvent ABC transporter permease [Mangrovitalea sediminis]
MELGIQGLHYETQSQSGTTDASGTYHYLPGETISFWVGNLKISDDIPAKPYLSPVDFFNDNLAQLNAGATDTYGLSSQRPVVKSLAATGKANNLMRLLMLLDDDKNTSTTNIDITQRTTDQVNAALPNLTQPIDLAVSPATFADNSSDPPSPANQLLNQICFYPVGDTQCNPPPSLAEIAAAPVKPSTNPDPNTIYQSDLEALRKKVLATHRHIGDIQISDAEKLLEDDTNIYFSAASTKYYLSASAMDIPASDTSLKELFVRKVGGDLSIEQMEAVSLNPAIITLQSFNATTESVDYFISGSTGQQGTILVNIKVSGDYRWYRKQLRVNIK